MRMVKSVEFDGFEWDEPKRLRVLKEREIDFADAARALLSPHLEKRSDQQDEMRFIAICPLGGELIAVVYTPRERNCRIITARAARKDERSTYHQIFG